MNSNHSYPRISQGKRLFGMCPCCIAVWKASDLTPKSQHCYYQQESWYGITVTQGSTLRFFALQK